MFHLFIIVWALYLNLLVVIGDLCSEILYAPWYMVSGAAGSYRENNESKITGINSWGIYSNGGAAVYRGICDFTYTSNYQSNQTSPLYGTCGVKWACASFQLEFDDYIHGYRVILGNKAVLGIYLYTNNGFSYDCIHSSIDINSTEDSGIIYHSGRALIGFGIGSGNALSAISFQFSPNCTHSPTSIPTTNPTINPTQEPTLPTLTPTIDPTIHPTVNPTLHPTLGPTSPPSKSPSEPTYGPTEVPSIDPTYYPTQDPTHDPTQEPTLPPTNTTDAPTIDPSTYPTIEPTIGPTIHPTVDPTTCVYYDGHEQNAHIELEGEYYFDIEAYIDTLKNEWQVLPQDMIILYSSINRAGDTIQCDDSETAIICVLLCEGKNHCIRTLIRPTSMTVETLVIICNAESSCKYMEIDLSATEIQNLTLICSSQSSCDSLQLRIESNHDVNTDIHCHDEEVLRTCQGIKIYLIEDGVNNQLKTSIQCYSEASCDNMYINANDAQHSDLSVSMYEHSDNVVVATITYDKITFICNAPDTARFIQYDIDTTQEKSDWEILQLVKDEYMSGSLPCEDIVILIDCSGNDDDDDDNNDDSYQCPIEYEYVNNAIDQNEILASDLNINCYWMDIDKLYKYTISCSDDVECKQDAASYALNLTVIVPIVIGSLVCVLLL